MKFRIATMALMSAVPAFAATAAHAEEAAPPPALLPALSGPLSYNPEPMSVDVAGSKLYVTAIGSGYVGTQSNTTAGVNSSFADLSNAQVIVQKPEGTFQFLVQAGLYNQETLGAAFVKSTDYTSNSYGVVPQAWIKIAPSANFNVQGGILPTLIGLEAPFTFQNINIERGILWGQENVMTRGVQANVTAGKLSMSLAYTDGFFSGKLNWLSGIVSYVDGPHTLSVVLGGALSKNYRSTFNTPMVQNNSTILNVIYSYSGSKWLVQPYFQYAWVPDLPQAGTTKAQNFAVGLLAKYKINDHWSLPVRFEYIDSNRPSATAASFLYGPGSSAFTFTVTPTYTWDKFFVRPEFSYVGAGGITPGSAFGAAGLNKEQVRGRLEFGVMF